MRERPQARALPLLGLLVGLWAIIPPYVVVFGALQVDATVEVVDHVVPGVAVIAMAALAALLLRTAEPSQLLLLVAGGVIALAGFWMLSTHAGLISQARQGIVPGGAVLWHGLPGIAVFVLGGLWSARFWSTADDAVPGPPGE